MDSEIIERIEQLESRLKSIQNSNAIYKSTFDSLEKEVELLREIAEAVDEFQQRTQYVAGDFGELYILIMKYREAKR